jgi:hypothetical protein
MSLGYSTLLADKNVDTKSVVDSESRVTRPSLGILWRRSLCAGLPAAEAKGSIVSPPQFLRGRLELDWVVYGMRTKTKKYGAEIRVRRRGR